MVFLICSTGKITDFIKKQGADAFNLAFEIAQQFINNADSPSDYEEYIF